MSIFPDNTGAALFPEEKMAAPPFTPYLAFRDWSDLTAMDSLINTAASTHAIHLARATKALACVPPRLDLFYFHSAMCNATVKALDVLQQEDWTRLGKAAPYIPLDEILSSLQSISGAVSPGKTPSESSQNKENI